ncbi:Alpha/Beta hydrolase protein [Aspergillus pseudodeflectus]|uniref:Alpha/Beta hydrolase protein n=1 Tax=Aspergillus pseudodeflectus TaxID=176178 RepID=A0ABR4K920_9EURO
MKSLLPFSMKSISIAIALSSFLATSASAQESTSTACDKDCQDFVDMGIAFERASFAHEGLDGFYTIPDDFDPSMEPGTLLRVEEHTDITNYTVPGGLTMSRIMYTSESLNGTVVPVSAFVLWPYAPFEYKTQHSSSTCSSSNTSTKFPLVAWAHGTSGVFPPCAPSNYRSLQYNFMTPYSLALDGFAVIATDYAGLGVTTLPNGVQSHAWLTSPAGANDVAYAIDAVRKAFPANLDADGPFVAMGHSQGGGVAWSFAERQAAHPQKGYRGTISISPATRVIDEIERAMQVFGGTEDTATVPIWAPTALGLQVKIVAAVTAVYPEYNDTGMSEAAYDRWHNVLEPVGGCLATDTLAFLSVTEQVRANWTADPLVREWQEVASAGRKAFRGPMLVIVGEEDALPVDMLEDDIEATCAVEGNEAQGLEMAVYGGMQHFPVIQASRGKWMRWIKERVSTPYTPAGHSSHSGGDGVCGKKSVVEGFKTQYSSHAITPNWLVSWAPPMEAWKYAL